MSSVVSRSETILKTSDKILLSFCNTHRYVATWKVRWLSKDLWDRRLKLSNCVGHWDVSNQNGWADKASILKWRAILSWRYIICLFYMILPSWWISVCIIGLYSKKVFPQNKLFRRATRKLAIFIFFVPRTCCQECDRSSCWWHSSLFTALPSLPHRGCCSQSGFLPSIFHHPSVFFPISLLFPFLPNSTLPLLSPFQFPFHLPYSFLLKFLHFFPLPTSSHSTSLLLSHFSPCEMLSGAK